jgi:integrase
VHGRAFLREVYQDIDFTELFNNNVVPSPSYRAGLFLISQKSHQVSHHPQTGSKASLTRNMVKSIANEAEIPKFHAHAARHWCATTLLKRIPRERGPT